MGILTWVTLFLDYTKVDGTSNAKFIAFGWAIPVAFFAMVLFHLSLGKGEHSIKEFFGIVSIIGGCFLVAGSISASIDVDNMTTGLGGLLGFLGVICVFAIPGCLILLKHRKKFCPDHLEDD